MYLEEVILFKQYVHNLVATILGNVRVFAIPYNFALSMTSRAISLSEILAYKGLQTLINVGILSCVYHAYQ